MYCLKEESLLNKTKIIPPSFSTSISKTFLLLSFFKRTFLKFHFLILKCVFLILKCVFLILKCVFLIFKWVFLILTWNLVLDFLILKWSFHFFPVNEFVISAFSTISAISAFSAISADLEMDFLHLKWFWFNIRSTEINIKNTEIQRLHFKKIKSPRKSRKTRKSQKLRKSRTLRK